MERLEKIHTGNGAIETVYKEEKDTGTLVYRLKRASINGHDLPPIEVRKDRNNITVWSIGSAKANVNVKEVTHFQGADFKSVEMERHRLNVGSRGTASGQEKRSIQSTRMYCLCKYAVDAV